MATDPIPLGVSACLLGHPVRYDGGDKNDPWIATVLSGVFQPIAICPEVEAGLAVPRPPMRLVGQGMSAPRLVTVMDGRDMTPGVALLTRTRMVQLATPEPRGFIFKSRSPSCGVASTPLHDDAGGVIGVASGLFAEAFMRRFPLAVVVEETELVSREGRAGFVERMFVADRWLRLRAAGMTRERLSTFQARHKFQVMAHDPASMRRLGRLAAVGDAVAVEAYGRELFAAMKDHASVEHQVDVLMHLFGFFKKDVTAPEKRNFLELLEAYRSRRITREVVRSWLRGQAVRWKKDVLLSQWYLFPDPREEALLSVGCQS
ncbi:MAG: DUF523 and DUF1722 domain-containing protein [Magnetococcales bacterium]|nr:DUF523 and DUF1722 domain-containing protein [Magnetococcales bacterium]